MHYLLLFSLLVAPLAPDYGNDRYSTPDRVGALSICAPPAAGDWIVDSDCLLLGARVAPGDVRLIGASTLQLAAGASLDIDFQSHNLRIGVDSRVLIGLGARLH